jgi:hypothetical protein
MASDFMGCAAKGITIAKNSRPSDELLFGGAKQKQEGHLIAVHYREKLH